MGFTLSKAVEVEMTTKKAISKRHERFRQKRRLKSFKKSSRISNDVSLPSPLAEANDSVDAITESDGRLSDSKGRGFHRRKHHITVPSPADVASLSSVQIAIGDSHSDYRNLGHTASFYKTPRKAIEKLIEKFNKEFEEVDLEQLENAMDEESQKKRQFVVAWRAALASSHGKLARAKCTGIPIAATSFCQQGISRWKRCHRCCLRCASASAAEHFLEDLLHKDSLDRFMYEEEEHQLTSSVVIKQDLRRSKLYESITQMDEEEIEAIEGRVDEEDLTVEVKFHVPIPVHIEHPPLNDLIHLPPPERMHKTYQAHQHQLYNELEQHQQILQHEIIATSSVNKPPPEKWIEKQMEHRHDHHHHHIHETVHQSNHVRLYDPAPQNDHHHRNGPHDNPQQQLRDADKHNDEQHGLNAVVLADKLKKIKGALNNK